MLADSQTYFQVRQTGAKVLSFLFSLSRKRKEKFVRFTRGKTLHDACQSSVEVQPSMHLINSYQLSVRVVILLLIWSIVYFDRCHFDLEVIDQWSFLLLANEMCCVRMMMNNTNDYRQVKIHRKRRATQEHIGKDERERRRGEYLFHSRRIRFRCAFDDTETHLFPWHGLASDHWRIVVCWYHSAWYSETGILYQNESDRRNYFRRSSRRSDHRLSSEWTDSQIHLSHRLSRWSSS